MTEQDREIYIQRYEERLDRFGYSPQALGWGTHGRQDVRFTVHSEPILEMPECRVLDVGCGFADFYAHLVGRGWRGNYTGIDLVPGLLRVAAQRHPGLDLRQLDIANSNAALPARGFDFVVASGIFNAKLGSEDNRDHIGRSLRAMFRAARIAVSADFLGIHTDYQRPGLWHTDPAWALGVAKDLSRRVALRCDYMPFEFCIRIFVDDSVTERHVFDAFEKSK